jgi:hypothetical protein
MGQFPAPSMILVDFFFVHLILNLGDIFSSLSYGTREAPLFAVEAKPSQDRSGLMGGEHRGRSGTELRYVRQMGGVNFTNRGNVVTRE